MTASVWQPGSGAIAVNAENASLIQKFIATAGQTVFNLTQFTYVVGTGSIRVYRNGVKLAVSEVTELSTTRFSLTVANLLVGEVIECSAVLGSQEAVTAAAMSAAASAATAMAAAATVDAANIVHLNGAETVLGAKTFKSGTLLLRNIADTISSLFYSAATEVRSWTLPDKDGTVVVTSNGAINTADVTDGNITQAKLAPNVAGTGPAFSAYHAVQKAYAGTSKILFDTLRYGSAAYFNNSRFTAPVAGYYHFNVHLYMSAGTPAYSSIFIYKNGSPYAQPLYLSSGFVINNVSTQILLAAGDYVEIWFNNTGAYSLGDASGGLTQSFSGYLARAA